MVMCSGVHSTVLRISELSVRTSDNSDLISAINGSQSLVAEINPSPRKCAVRCYATYCTTPTRSLS
ncbi:hypothetical protein RHMOL_Rhmol10G0133600 [Rhododendron molle]|uniref:Uncharacterized protein n=1 Tax=Rhododendron molle TaxID=49168 RepID=A0ACC0M238_RHOML|nr:hypothetical protein RHMOL_Rhmol10G0133600 [Rhododendron molle]